MEREQGEEGQEEGCNLMMLFEPCLVLTAQEGDPKFFLCLSQFELDASSFA